MQVRTDTRNKMHFGISKKGGKRDYYHYYCVVGKIFRSRQIFSLFFLAFSSVFPLKLRVSLTFSFFVQSSSGPSPQSDCGSSYSPNPYFLVAPRENHADSLHCKILLLSTMGRYIKKKIFQIKMLKILILCIPRAES